MENEISGDELKSCLTQEYSKLLVKAEELLKDTPASSEFMDIDTISLSADGQFGRFMLINMCVPDSFLMAFFICFMKYDCIASLFHSFEKLRAPMVFLKHRMYNEAKAFWLFSWLDWLDYPTSKVTNYIYDNEKYEINAWSEPNDHLHMLNELVLPRDHISPHAEQLSEKTLSKFERFGDVHGFGFSDLQPLLVLVDTQVWVTIPDHKSLHSKLDTAPPPNVDDDYGRTFELQFLLLTRVSCPSHVIAGLNIFDRWVLYDDLNLRSGDFNLKSEDFKDDFIILFAGYVNITKDQDRDVPYGVPEEGYQGTVPFNPSRGFNDYEKEHID